MLSLLASAALGCTGPRRFTRTFLGAFDTSVTVTVYCGSSGDFDALFDAAEADFMKYHRLFDIYNEYDGITNLCTVNANAGRGAVKVCGELTELLGFGKEMFALSGGRVNIMLGAVLGVWHEYRERGLASPESASLPGRDELSAADAHCDIESLVIDEAAGTVEIKDPEASIDVGAIAKGFAVDKVCEHLRELGCGSVLINAGGNIGTIGTKPNGEEWLAAVQNPFAFASDGAESGSAAPDAAYRRMASGALATSGDYQRYYVVDGRRYHHIIDPETLFPAEYSVSATVFSDSAALADALSTALFLMPPDDAIAFARSLSSDGTGGAEAFIVTLGGSTLSCGDWLPPVD